MATLLYVSEAGLAGAIDDPQLVTIVPVVGVLEVQSQREVAELLSPEVVLKALLPLGSLIC